MNDEDGFDGEIPEELRAWFEAQEENKRLGLDHYILVNGKIKTVNLIEFAEWFGNFNNRLIDRTDISNESKYPGGRFISTVFLGMNANQIDTLIGGEQPMLFETMVFGGEFDQRMWRYSSYGEAKRGHWIIVDQIRAGVRPNVEFGERPFIDEFMEMLQEDVKKEDEDET